MTVQKQIKLFVSYPNEQLELARELSDFLRSVALNVWFDKDALIGGHAWDRERLAAQRDADLTILIWSKETATRAGVIQSEIKEALKRQAQMPLGSIMLVVCRSENIAVPAELGNLQYIDLFEPNWRVKICRSISLKHTQMNVALTPALIDF